jgi:lysozyme
MEESLDLSALYSSVKIHEGYRNVSYMDTEKHLTVGIGHKVTSRDNIKLGQKISADRVKRFFNTDIRVAYRGARSLLVDFDAHPRAIKNVLTEMVFQMGRSGVAEFEKTIAFFNNRDYKSASIEMLNSDWARQTPNRARNLSRVVSVQKPLVLSDDDSYIQGLMNVFN